MSDNTITYEQPLNERIRQFLRLEYLFQQSLNTLSGESDWESRNTLSCLVDILEILSRSDVKTDVLKFLERLQINFSQLRGNTDVDNQHLDTLLDKIDGYYSELHSVKGKPGHELKQHHFLSCLLQRSTVTAGVTSFDIPLYHHWLKQPAEERISMLEGWHDSLDVIRHPIDLILDLVRSSTESVTVKTEQGFYHQALDTNRTYQLIRVTIPSDTPYFAEISGGKHRVSIRFLQAQDSDRPVQTHDDLCFQLSCCAL